MDEKPSRPKPPSGQPNEQPETQNTGSTNFKEIRTAAEINAAKKAEKSQRPWHKKKRYWLLAITALFVMLGALQNDDETSNDTTPEGRLSSAVLKETGKTNLKGYGSRIQLVEWSSAKTTIQLLGDENISTGLTKSSNRRLVLETIAAYKKSGLSSETIVVEVFYPLVDNLGNESLNRVLGYGFSQERISRIQPDNIDPKQMDSNFADLFTSIHPAFRL